MARKHFIPTAILFFLAYIVAPWASTVVINHFAHEQEFTKDIDKSQVSKLNISTQHDLK